MWLPIVARASKSIYTSLEPQYSKYIIHLIGRYTRAVQRLSSADSKLTAPHTYSTEMSTEMIAETNLTRLRQDLHTLTRIKNKHKQANIPLSINNNTKD